MKKPQNSIFDTWTFQGKQYLCLSLGLDNVVVIDSEGFSYGNWYTFENFKRARRSQNSKPANGVCPKIVKVRIRVEAE